MFKLNLNLNKKLINNKKKNWKLNSKQSHTKHDIHKVRNIKESKQLKTKIQ